MKYSVVPFLLFLAACPSSSSSNNGGADGGGPDAATAATDASTGGDGPKIGGPLFLSIDGRSAQFNFTPVGPITDVTFLKYWSIGNPRAPKPLIPNEVYTNFELQTIDGKDLLDSSVTAADIKEVALDVTYSVDTKVAGGWGLTIQNPATVASAKFTFSNKGGKIDCHVEGVGVVKDVNKDKVPTSPKLVFEVHGLPGKK